MIPNYKSLTSLPPTPSQNGVGSAQGTNSQEQPLKFNATVLTKLEDLEKANSMDSPVQYALKVTAHKIKSVDKFFTTHKIVLESKHNAEISRTQEHISPRGSLYRHQFPQFTTLLKSNPSAGCDKFEKELKSIVTVRGVENEVVSARERTKKMVNAVKNLAPGESVIIVSGDELRPTPHSTMMRITCNNDGIYDLHFANTGLGIDSNPDFHPKEGHQYQTVALIPGISRKNLLDNHFFETYCNLALGEKIPDKSCLSNETKGIIQDALKDLAGDNNVLQRSALYRKGLYMCMRTLGEPVTVKDDPRYYSRTQIGGSCVASSIWSIGRVVMSQQEFKAIEADSKVQSVLRSYKKIKNGYDTSSTKKIIVLDQIQSLKQIYKHQENDLQVLGEIERELLSSLKMDRVEVSVSHGLRLNLNRFMTPVNGKKNEFNLQPMTADYKVNKTLKADVEWKPFKSSKVENLTYQVRKDENGHLIGNDHADSCYLLYVAMASGDQKKCGEYLQLVLDSYDHLPAEKQKETDLLLHSLLKNLVTGANTRSDIAKQNFILTLLNSHNTNLVSESYANYVRDSYSNLEVELHLPSDNIWVVGIKKLETKIVSNPKIEKKIVSNPIIFSFQNYLEDKPGIENEFKLRAQAAKFSDSVPPFVNYWEAASFEENELKKDYFVDVVFNPGTLVYEGKTLLDDSYLLYVSIANGDKKMTEACMKRLMENAYPVENAPSVGVDSAATQSQLKQTSMILSMLVKAQEKETTPTAVAQGYYLSLLVNSFGIYSSSPTFMDQLAVQKKRYEALAPSLLPADSVVKSAIEHFVA